MNNGKTIKIFLPNGDPKGIKKAEITTDKIKVIQSSRKDFYEDNSKTFDFVGIYVLVDSLQEDIPQVYIGKGKIADRLSLHYKDTTKDFWNLVFAIKLDTEAGFNDGHISYLEHYFVKLARDLKLSVLENKQNPQPQKLEESIECELKDYINTIELLLATLGLKIFQRPDGSKKIKFFIKNTFGAIGEGEYTREGFVVFKGAKFRKEPTDKSSAKRIIPKLKNNGYLKEDAQDKNLYILTQDYTFSSPSAASDLITGQSTNGWDKWKTKDGKTLNDVYPARKV